MPDPKKKHRLKYIKCVSFIKKYVCDNYKLKDYDKKHLKQFIKEEAACHKFKEIKQTTKPTKRMKQRNVTNKRHKQEQRDKLINFIFKNLQKSGCKKEFLIIKDEYSNNKFFILFFENLRNWIEVDNNKKIIIYCDTKGIIKHDIYKLYMNIPNYYYSSDDYYPDFLRQFNIGHIIQEFIKCFDNDEDEDDKKIYIEETFNNRKTYLQIINYLNNTYFQCLNFNVDLIIIIMDYYFN